MKKVTVCMLVLGDVKSDIRVQKEARSLALEGYRVTIIGTTYTRKYLREIAGSPRLLETVYVGNNSYIIKRIYVNKGGLIKYITYWLKIKKYLRDKNFDIIHYHDLNVLPLIKYLKDKATYHVYDSHELFPEMMSLTYGKLGLKVFNWLERKYIDYADKILIPSKPCKEYMLKKYPNLDIEVIENFSELVVPFSQPEKYKLFTIVLWGNIYPDRGYEEFLEAIFLMKESVEFENNFRVLIIGTGKSEKGLRDFVEKRGLENIIYFRGWTSPRNAFEIMRKSHLGICLFKDINKTIELASPNRLFEYLKCGLPVVISPIIGHKSIFRDEDAFVFYCNPNNIYELSILLMSLCNMKRDRIKRLGRNAYYSCLRRFNWNNVEKKLLKVYEELCENEWI